MMTRTRRYTKYFLVLLSGMAVSCLVIALVGYFSNQNLPAGPTDNSQIAEVDKIRLAEAIHLRSTLADEIWPGWGAVAIPLILWNTDYEFLVGVSDPPQGWVVVPGDSFENQPYFRRPAADPQNFAVALDDEWAASMATKSETDRFIRDVFVDVLPPVVEDIFPYRLLIQPSEVQICGMLHESFHVFQIAAAREVFDAAEAVYSTGDDYWSADEAMHAEWETEIELLIKAVQADDVGDTTEYTRQFLAQRDQRRLDNALSADLIAFERYFEWLEGTAKYVELAIWEKAAQKQAYLPLLSEMTDPDFKAYQTFESHFGREIDQAQRQASQESDVRFYYTGMLQGRILDRLLPDWKSRTLQKGAFLDDLLREAISP